MRCLKIRKKEDCVESKQFSGFWEIECPHCKKKIELEIIVNLLSKDIVVKKIEKN